MSSKTSQRIRKEGSAVPGLARKLDINGQVAQRLFESKVLTIAVDKSKIVLNVYEEALKKTAFFKVEGPPATDVEKESMLKETLRGLTSDKPVEIDINDERDVKIDFNSTTLATSATIADYYLYEQDTKIFQLKAFKMFLLFLYNLPSVTVSSTSDVQVMLKAYCLTRRYECIDIQNAIVDLLCLYHIETEVDFDGLLWMVAWGGDNTECPLVAYLIEQTAFEIARTSFVLFQRKNESITRFIEVGNSRIRLKLFAVMARHASNPDLIDPATRAHAWHVSESQAQGREQGFEAADDCIILD